MWHVLIQLNNSIRYKRTVPKRMERTRYKLPGPGGPEVGPEPDGVAYVFLYFALISSFVVSKI
jgi:hypothetical protein